MPLTPNQRYKLYEIYEISLMPLTTVTGGGGNAMPATFDVARGVKEQLEMALVSIDADESQVLRVGEILTEYDNWALDYSSIDREGYALRPSKNLKRVRAALYAYTGILFKTGSDRRIPMG